MKLEDSMGRDKENFARWQKENLKRYEFKLNVTSEADVIEYLDKIPNRRQYLIELIRQDIKKGG